VPFHECGFYHPIEEECPDSDVDIVVDGSGISQIRGYRERSLPAHPCFATPRSTATNRRRADSIESVSDDSILPPPVIYLNGVVDMDALNTTSKEIREAAMNNLMKGVPMLAVPDSAESVDTFKDPLAWIRAYPTLYPRGVGGPPISLKYSSDPDNTCVRRTPLSAEMYFRHCLNLHKSRFASDPGWMFVAQNKVQIADLLRSSRTSAGDMDPHDNFLNVTEDLINQAFQNKASGAPRDLNTQRFLQCLRHSGGQVRGTDQERLKWREMARAYTLRFGVPTVWLTFAPSDQHNPIVAYLAGERIEVDAWCPKLACSQGRLRLLAQNPVAQTKFFHLFTKAFIDAMLGWDFEKCQARTNTFADEKWNDSNINKGGVLGEMEAFFAPGHCHVHCASAL
jgi:hypothetical protein